MARVPSARGRVNGRIPYRLVMAVIALAALALLVLRSRPLARFVGGIEPLLYATGLTEPRALLSLPDGTILLAEGGTGRVVEVGLEGQLLSPRASRGLPASAVDIGGAWAIAEAPEGATLATVREAGKLVRASERAGAIGLDTVASFVGSDGFNPQPTGVAVAPHGQVYVALFATVANRAGSGKVVRVGRDGTWEVAYDTLSFPVGLGFDRDGQLHVLELAQRYDERGGRYSPGTGRLMAIGPARYQRRTLIRDLTLPTGMVFTPAGDLYLTENAFQTGPAEARLLRVPAQGLRPGG